MSVFGNILSKIFHHDPAAADAAPTPAGTAPAPAGATPAPTETASADTPTTATPETPAATPAAASSAAPAQTVDVAAVLDGLASKNAQTLDWKHSIVDMMKLLDLDSSLSSRKQLATELHYSGDMNDSASMNVWLHSEVMKKLAENGGKVPADLKA